MIKTSKYFRDSVRASGREDIDCYVLIGGRKVTKKDIETLRVNYSLGNSDIPSIGNACSAYVSMTLYRRGDTPNYLYQDKTVVPYIGFKVFNGRTWSYEYVKLGTFYVPNSDNVTKNRNKISLVCYDKMAQMGEHEKRQRVKIDNEKPEVPTGTVKSVCQWLSRKANIQFDYDSIEEDIPITVSPAGINVRQVLQELAFIQGKNCIVDRDDKFKFIRPKEVDFKEFNIKAKNTVGLTWEADQSSTIAALRCTQLNYTRLIDERDDDAHTYIVYDGRSVELDPDDYDSLDILNDNQITGVDFHTSIITSVDELEAVYNRCMPYSYGKFKMSTQGFPQVEIGDIIKLVTVDGEEVSMLIANHQITYDGGCISNFNTTGSDNEFLDVEDIDWWELKTREPDEPDPNEALEKRVSDLETREIKVVDGSSNTAGFDFNYLITVQNSSDPNGKPDVNYLFANKLIKFVKDKDDYLKRVRTADLEYNKDTGTWKHSNVEEYRLCDCKGEGGINSSTAERLKDIEDRIKKIEDNCGCVGGGGNTGGGDTGGDDGPSTPSTPIPDASVSNLYLDDTYPIYVKSNFSGDSSSNPIIAKNPFFYGTTSCAYVYGSKFSVGNECTNAIFSTFDLARTKSPQSNTLPLLEIHCTGMTRSIYILRPESDTSSWYNKEYILYDNIYEKELAVSNYNHNGYNGYLQKSKYYNYFMRAISNGGWGTENYPSELAFNDGYDGLGRHSTYCPSTISRGFVKIVGDYKPGYTSILSYKMDGEYNMRLQVVSHLSNQFVSPMLGLNLQYSAEIKNAYQEDRITIDYNPTFSKLNTTEVIPTYCLFGSNNDYDRENGPYVSSLVCDTRPYNGGVLIGFGKITGSHSDSYRKHWLDYTILEGIFIKPGWKVGSGGFAPQYVIN